MKTGAAVVFLLGAVAVIAAVFGWLGDGLIVIYVFSAALVVEAISGVALAGIAIAEGWGRIRAAEGARQ